MNDNEVVYYKIYKKDNIMSVECLQWFDEQDYEQDKFVTDNKGNVLKFDNEKDALEELNKYIYEFIERIDKGIYKENDYVNFDLNKLSNIVLDLKCIEVSNNWKQLINNYKNEEVIKHYKIEVAKIKKEYDNNEGWCNTMLDLSFPSYRKYLIEKHNNIILNYLKEVL